MKYKEITVGRSETLPQKEPYSSTKLFHQITVEVCENDNIAGIVEHLHSECQKLLDETKKKNGHTEKSAATTANNANGSDEFKSGAELMKENKDNNNCNGGNADVGSNGKLRDKRNRSVKELMEELKIKSEMQANFLRWNEKISYNEWQRLHDWFNGREIVQMARR